MTSADWDVSQLDKLAVDLGHGSAKVVRNARAVIEAGARHVRDGARERVKGVAHAPAYPSAITYDMHGLEAEIGPDKNRRQGALGNILEFGTSKNAPVPHLGPALDAAEPAIVAGLTFAAGELL